ncbi:MAG: adenine-specific DNA-methyltransferase [Blastocatellia bacterium]|jgi:adenine-specific DNA-methyltransferase|nr:adenine-specific DNA-methyltransferase [Blastocatellia bacterium]
MSKRTKLELTWIGKEKRPRLEPRLLLEDAALSYHAVHRVTDNDLFDNRLIYGDNLLALKALEQEFADKIKCIYIDPPYNTGAAYTHYDDGIEHSLWLSLMRDRLEMLRRLLSEDGSLWISIDADESHYLKVLCDEIFGRANFVDEVVWQRAYSPINLKKTLSRSHDNILVYAKSVQSLYFGKLPRSEEANNRYSNPDNDPRGAWKAGDLSVGPIVQDKVYEITLPSGRKVVPPSGYCWRLSKARLQEYIEDTRIWFGPNGNSVPAIKRFLSEVKEGITPMTLWLRGEVGDNQEAKRESKAFNDADVFETPKPERLMQRIIQLATQPGDIVLDSFAGSGTTGAVAHKLGRRWIMIELGEHIHTHIIPRIKKVVDGIDEGGISHAVEWKGGGGFRYFHLAPSLLEKDGWGNWVVNKQYNAAMLAESLCKHEGFTYAPSDTVYWQHGHSTERDFIYVTTQTLNRDQLAAIAEAVGDERTLLICCGAFRANAADFPNLTLKKIPNAVLNRCEWGRDDYSLQIASLPAAEPTPDGDGEAPPPTTARRTRRAETPLFEQGGES